MEGKEKIVLELGREWFGNREFEEGMGWLKERIGLGGYKVERKGDGVKGK